MGAAEYQPDSRSVRIRSLWLGLAMAGSVVPYFFFETDQLRGVVCAAVAAMSLLIVLFTEANVLTFFTRPTLISLTLCLVMIGAIGYGTMRAIYFHNNSYYIAADLFHWLVEMFLMALLARIAFQGTPSVSARVAVFSCFIVTVVTTVLVVGCYAGVVKYGGYFQGNSRFWHLKGGVNFPQVPLLICCLALISCRTLKPSIRKLGWCVVGLCVVLLIMTLKRTMWVSTVGMICLCFIPSRSLRNLGVLACVTGIAVSAITVVRGSDLFGSLNFMTYNEAYSVADTMDDRKNQLSDAVRLFSLAGHGLGAEVDVYEVGTNKPERIHYLHSLYVYQILQLGIPVAAICFCSILVLIFQIQNLPSHGLTADWRIPAGLSCLIGVSLNGVTLVSTHSAFYGVAVGLAIAAINEFRDEPAKAEGVSTDQDVPSVLRQRS